MADEGEEIYDDGSSAFQSPINNLKSRFEQKPEQNSAPKNLNPALKPKPPPPVKNLAKFGGGGFLHGVVVNDKIPKLPVNGTVGKGNDLGAQNKNDSSTVKDKESAKQVLNNVLGKRESLVKIPDVFRAIEESSQHTPPKITPKPKPPPPVRKTFDTNNNSKPDTKETVKNSVPDSKETEKALDNKMTAGVDKEKCSEAPVSQGSNSTVGLSIAERQKLLANKLHPESKPGIKPTHPEKPKSPAGTGSPKSPKFTIPNTKSQNVDFAVELRRKIVDSSDPKKSLHRVSVKSVIRNFDTKKFRIAPREGEKDIGPAPEKPPTLGVEIDWEDLITEFQNSAQEKGFDEESNKHSMGVQELIEEEFYDDCGNMVPGERVSFIEPMTEEEELAELAEEMKWNKACKSDTEEFPRPPSGEGFAQEEYDDVATAMTDEKEESDDAGELYEPLPDEDEEPPPPVGPKPGEAQEEPPEVPPPPPPEPPRPNKDPKESEKERKKKEREEKERKLKEEKEEKERKKKQEKEQKKKEQELKNLEKNFKISMSDLTKTVGQGRIKATVTKAPKYNLVVQEGQKVEIIRMNDPNPKGKFLVRLIESQTVGFVDSSNIEVDTSIIRRLMEGSCQESSNAAAASNGASGQDDESIGGEMYEFVEGEGQEELIEDDIYEECT